MRKLQVKDVLTRIKEPIKLEDNVIYKRVTIKTKHQGVFLRDSQYGKDIGTKKQFLIKKGQFLLSKIDARNGAFGIVPDEVDGAIITGNFWTYEVNEEELNIELFYIMTSLPFFDELCKNSSSGSTNRQYLDEKKFLNQEITLPPIEEQNSFIEHFKKLQEKHSQTLEELQTQSELISKLRNSILSDAVSGKLVPQDLNDDSAEVLLEKIKAEKEKLTKAGKIKKQKPLPPISEEEIPYKLPDGWVWCRFVELANLVEFGTSSKATEFGDVPVISMGHIQNGEVVLNNFSYIKKTNKDLPRLFLKTNDLLFNRTNSYALVGKTALFEDKSDQYSFASYLIRIQLHKSLIEKFYNFCLGSPYFRTTQIEPQITKQCGQANFNGTKLKNTIVPLPSLEEQKQIVEKVEKLMARCDELELEVQNSKIETEKLMQSVLKEAFI